MTQTRDIGIGTGQGPMVDQRHPGSCGQCGPPVRAPFIVRKLPAGIWFRRPILPVQETVETGADGSLTLRFLACSDEEVVMCLKPWLPHVRVVKPGYIGDRLVQEFRQWIAWQGSGVM